MSISPAPNVYPQATAPTPSGKKGGLDLNTILPFLMLAAPILEMRSPGSGLGLAAGLTAYTKEQSEKRRRDSQALLGLLADVEDENLGMAEEALVAQGYDRATVKAMGKASRAFVDPGKKAERALSQLVEDPNLGLIPRRTQIDVQARQQQFQQEQAVETQRFERGQTANLAGEARRVLFEMAQNPDPRVRAQSAALARRLSSGEDPQAILAEATAVAQQAGEFAAGREQQTRQQAFRSQRIGELEKEVASGVPAARARIIRLAREQGLDPKPYLQQLAQNIRVKQLEIKALEKQTQAQAASLSLNDLKLAVFAGQIDAGKLSDEQRHLIGLPPKPKLLSSLTRQEILTRVARIERRLTIIAGTSGKEMTIEQALKLQDEEDNLLEEREKLVQLPGYYLRVGPGR